MIVIDVLEMALESLFQRLYLIYCSVFIEKAQKD